MRKVLLAATALGLISVGSAKAQLFVEGSSFTVQGSNTPGGVLGTNNAIIKDGVTQDLLVAIPGTVLGHLNLVVNETPVTGGGEWITFDYSPPFGTLVGFINQNWNLAEAGLQTNQSTSFTKAFLSFDHNGTNLAPNNCSIFGAIVSSNPVPGGSVTGCLNSTIDEQFSAGTLPPISIGIDPFSGISSAGIDPTQVTSFFEALLFTPQSGGGGGVPEPSTLAVLGLGFTGLLTLRRKA